MKFRRKVNGAIYIKIKSFINKKAIQRLDCFLTEGVHPEADFV